MRTRFNIFMFYLFVMGFGLCYSINVAGRSLDELKLIVAEQAEIENDLQLILKEAKLNPDQISFVWQESALNSAAFYCEGEKVKIEIKAEKGEWSSVFYFALQKLGFYFPHPRVQISPEKLSEEFCGEEVFWKPALKYRGFHFHTMHPSEWVHGFLMGKTQIVEESIRWLARNQQNVYDFSFLRINEEGLYKYLPPLILFAERMGIHSGISFGIALQQQKSWKTVSILGSLSDKISKKEIDKKLRKLLDALPLSFINIETGTSEFTAPNYERSLNWLNQAAAVAKEYDVNVISKVHVSSNLDHEEYGNFNFLVQYADSTIGMLAHTVFYYSLEDRVAPMYGNDNFHSIRDFMLQERGKRMNWFYPETSYYISLDIDIPLLHLEYLRGRAEDMKFIFENGILGQLNFTTGHELGYWLFDWTLALLNNLEYDFDPLIGLKLLGEEEEGWQKHLDFHYEYMTKEQLVQIVTFSNGGDELIPKHKIHKRNLMRELSKSDSLTNYEIGKLRNAINHIPSTNGIKNKELKAYLDITYLRFYHALETREALFGEKERHLKSAAKYRGDAQIKMDSLIETCNRYPEALIFEYHKNPTSYAYGYGAMAKDLYYWKREEEMVRKKKYHPFFMKVYDYFPIIF